MELVQVGLQLNSHLWNMAVGISLQVRVRTIRVVSTTKLVGSKVSRTGQLEVVAPQLVVPPLEWVKVASGQCSVP